MDHLSIRIRLHPTPSQAAALDNRYHTAQLVWSAFIEQARREAVGLPSALLAAAHHVAAGGPLTPTPALLTTLRTRTVTDRCAELDDVAGIFGWREQLGRAVLDQLAAEAARTFRALPLDTRLDALPVVRPGADALGMRGLLRPVSANCIEVVGLGQVLAPVFSLPVTAGTATDVWRAQFAKHLRDTRDGHIQGLLLGDADADAAYLTHVARYADLADQLMVPLVPTGGGWSSVRLRFTEESRLVRLRQEGQQAYAVEWRYCVEDLQPPRDPRIIAVDPGISVLYAWATRCGVGRYDNRLPGAWRAPAPAPLPGQVHRPLDLAHARLARQALLHRRYYQPVLEEAAAHFLNHTDVGWEATSLTTGDYPAFREFSGADVYDRYLRDVAKLGHGRVWLDIDPADTTSTCAQCGARRAMRFCGRAGRCTVCKGRAHRDEGAARNLLNRTEQALRWVA